VIRAIYGGVHVRMLEGVSERIREGSSVTDVCCGTAQLYRWHLRGKARSYLGLDGNQIFIAGLKRRGVAADLCDVRSGPIEAADYITVCSAFYHFYDRRDEIFAKLLAAARVAVIISEPIENMSSFRFRPLAALANWFSNPGIGEHDKRFNLDAFRSFSEQHGCTHFLHQPGEKYALAVFQAPGGSE
jgi:SAM-dependent methyltransferase